MSSLNVRILDADLQRLASNFHSGNEILDGFLRSSIAIDINYGTTYVLLSEDNDCIIGYYSLSLGCIEYEDMGIRLKQGGAVHLNYFALAQEFRGLLQHKLQDGTEIYLSDILLVDCIDRIKTMRDTFIGFTYITLSSTHEGYRLYKRNHFEDIEEDMTFLVEKGDLSSAIPMYYTFCGEE